MNKTPILCGHPYTDSAHTDLRKKFAQIRKKLREEEEQKKAELERISRNVLPMSGRK